MDFFGVANGFEMVGVAFLLEAFFDVVNGEAIANQDAWKDFAEHRLKDAAPAAFVHQIEGAPRMGKDPEPAQGAGQPPTGFIDMERRGLEQFLANPGILRFDFGRDAGQGMGESAWGEAQAEVVLQHRAGFAHGQALCLVQIGRDGQRSRTELDGGGAGGLRNLQGVAGTGAFSAAAAGGLVGAQAGDERTHLGDFLNELLDLFLINPLLGAALRTGAQIDGDLLVELRGPDPAGSGVSRFAPRAFGRGAALLLRHAKRGGLAQGCLLRALQKAFQFDDARARFFELLRALLKLTELCEGRREQARGFFFGPMLELLRREKSLGHGGSGAEPLAEIRAQRVEVNVLERHLQAMLSVGPAAPAALAHALPIGRTVADSGKAFSLHKGLREAWHDRVLALPIPSQAAQQPAQNVTGQMGNLHVWQDQKAGVIDHRPEMLAPLRRAPANEGLAGSYLPGCRAKKRAG